MEGKNHSKHEKESVIMEGKNHSKHECKVKCEALKSILTQIQEVSGMEQNYSIRHLAESGLDLIRELKGEFED